MMTEHNYESLDKLPYRNEWVGRLQILAKLP